MKLTKIEVQNFRLFELFECNFHEKLTVLVANNGGGKSSVLDAVRVALGGYLSAFEHGSATGIMLPDVHQTSLNNFNKKKHFPVMIKAEGDLGDNKAAIWSRSLTSAKSGTTIKDMKPLLDYGKQTALEEDSSAIWPVLAYYGTGRLWNQKKLTSSKQALKLFDKRDAGYLDCMEPASSYKQFVDWFSYAHRVEGEAKLRFIEENQNANAEAINAFQNEYSHLILAVQEAIDIVLKDTGWSRIYYSTKEKSLQADHQVFGNMPVGQLSDGLRNTIAMVGDLAYRSAQLNPHLASHVCKEIAGIVLIDEVDMHLHPQWQQVILQQLQQAFPNIQFIVTTHSPQVLSTVKRENIRVLEPDENGHIQAIVPEYSPLGHEAGDALSRIMDVPTRPKMPFDDLVKTYEQLVRDNLEDTAEAKTIKQQLDEVGYVFKDAEIATWRFLANRKKGDANG
jgi:predicted ATP-binding protein involved in virulence